MHRIGTDTISAIVSHTPATAKPTAAGCSRGHGRSIFQTTHQSVRQTVCAKSRLRTGAADGIDLRGDWGKLSANAECELTPAASRWRPSLAKIESNIRSGGREEVTMRLTSVSYRQREKVAYLLILASGHSHVTNGSSRPAQVVHISLSQAHTGPGLRSAMGVEQEAYLWDWPCELYYTLIATLRCNSDAARMPSYIHDTCESQTLLIGNDRETT